MIYEIIDTRTGERAKAYELVQEPWAEKTHGCDWPAFAIDEDGEAMLTDDCGNYDMVPEGRVEVRLVVDREKWEPCDVCKDAKYINGWAMAAVPNQDGLYETRIEGDFDYCPACGRPLTFEAWVWWEKKIRGCVE